MRKNIFSLILLNFFLIVTLSLPGNCLAVGITVKLLGSTSLNVSDTFKFTGSTCEPRDMSELQQLIKHGMISMDIRTLHGKTLLHVVSAEGDVDTVKFLVENGADVNAIDNSGRTAITLAIMNDRKQVIEYLLENGASLNLADNQGVYPLHWAVENRDLKLVVMLLRKGADYEYAY